MKNLTIYLKNDSISDSDNSNSDRGVIVPMHSDGCFPLITVQASCLGRIKLGLLQSSELIPVGVASEQTETGIKVLDSL